MREKLLKSLTEFGQQHLLEHWDRLDQRQRDALAEQIGAIDFEQIGRLFSMEDVGHDRRTLLDRAKPPTAVRLDTSKNSFKPDEAKTRASDTLSRGVVGVVLVAGGQGTRLGFEHPKGMFQIGPVSGHSLFQIHIEKIVAAARRYGVRIPLYLMTSPATHVETREFLEENGRFGLASEDLYVFCQGTMPAVDARTGNVLLETPSQIAVSPDGHGGMLSAMSKSGLIDDVRSRGIEQLFYFQVDNPLVDICGQEFLGYHLLTQSELSSQVIAKRDSQERVGNVIDVDGKLHVIEYSDLPLDIANRCNEDGSLLIWAGSIAVHVMAVSLLERMIENIEAMPFHLAHKKVEHVDSTGRIVRPTEPNAIKFERFIFDMMPHATNAIVVEVDRSRAFAPLKNAFGQPHDTPETVRAQMVDECVRWLKLAGAHVDDRVLVEISPLFALDPDELAEKVGPKNRVTEPMFFSY